MLERDCNGVLNTKLLDFTSSASVANTPTLDNTESFYKTIFGIQLHYDAPEIRADYFDFATTPTSIEIVYYSNKNSTFYIYSRQDNTAGSQELFSIHVNQKGTYTISGRIGTLGAQQLIWDTNVQAYTGWSYIVFIVYNYGIGAYPSTTYHFYACNQNIAKQINQLPVCQTAILKDIQYILYDSTSLGGWYLFGHKGQRKLVPTCLHLDGFIYQVRFIQPSTFTQQTEVATVVANWQNILFTFFHSKGGLDAVYWTKLDFQTINEQYETVIDFSSYASIVLPYGNNYVYYGSSTSNLVDNPLNLPSIGTKFSVGTYAQNPSALPMLASYNTLDFTLEFWLRFDYNAEIVKGKVGTLFGKELTAGNYEYAVQISDQFLRIVFNGQEQDIDYTLLQNADNQFKEVTYTSKLDKILTNNISFVWKMVACNFKRAQQLGGYKAYVYLDDSQQPIELFFPGLVTLSTTTNKIYAGKDFQGVLKSIVIYSQLLNSTYYDKYIYSGTYYEFNKLHYPYIEVNDMDATNPSCQRRSFSQKPCYTCSLQNIGSTSVNQLAKTCYTTCELDTYGSACSECDYRCSYCTSYSINYCQSCNLSTGVYRSTYGACLKDIGYYQNSSINRYQPCDYRCQSCDDSTNYCKVCVDGNYLIYGGLCVSNCPDGYINGNSSGLCELNATALNIYNQNTTNYLFPNCDYNQYEDYDGNCQNCHSSCGSCQGVGSEACLTCARGRYLFNNNTCLPCNYNKSSSNYSTDYTCVNSRQSTSLQEVLVTAQNNLILVFDLPITSTRSYTYPITIDDFILKIKNASQTNAQWQTYNGTWFISNQTNLSNLPSTNILIDTDFNQTGFNYSVYAVQVLLSSTNKLVDEYGYQLNIEQWATARLNIIPSISIYLAPTDYECIDLLHKVGLTVSSILVSSMMFILLTSFLTMKPISLALILFLGMQTLLMSSLINIPTTQPYLSSYFLNFKFTLLNFDFPRNQIIRDYLLNFQTKTDVYGERFSILDYKFNNSFVNISSLIWLWAFFYIIYAPVSLLLGLFIKFAFKKFKFNERYAYGFMLKPFFTGSCYFFILQIYPLVLPTLLELNYLYSGQLLESNPDQLKVYKIEEQSRDGAFFIISAVIFGMIVFITTIFAGKEQQSFWLAKAMYGPLFNPYKNSMFGYALYFLYIMKSLSSVVVVVYCQYTWEGQCIYFIVSSFLMSLYISLFRPFKLIIINFQSAILEGIIGGHYMIMLLTFKQSLDNDLFTLMLYDILCFGSFLIFIIFDTARILYKWWYFRSTGKLPSKKNYYFNKDLNAQLQQEATIHGLLTEKSSNQNQDYLSSSVSTQKTKRFKGNNFLEALEQEEGDLGQEKQNKKDSEQKKKKGGVGKNRKNLISGNQNPVKGNSSRNPKNLTIITQLDDENNTQKKSGNIIKNKLQSIKESIVRSSGGGVQQKKDSSKNSIKNSKGNEKINSAKSSKDKQQKTGIFNKLFKKQ